MSYNEVTLRYPESIRRSIVEQYVRVERHQKDTRSWWLGNEKHEIVINMTAFDQADYAKWSWLSEAIRGVPATTKEDVIATFSQLEMVQCVITEPFAWWENSATPTPQEKHHA